MRGGINPLNIRLGAGLKKQRKQQGLTLASLAKRSGLTPAYISLLERDKAMPSINTLFILANALGVHAHSFFELERSSATPESNVILRRQQRPLVKYEHGFIDELLIPKAQTRIEMMYCHVPVGDWTVKEYRHSGNEAGVVIQGVLELKVDGQSYILEAGDSFAYDSQQAHCYRNAGETECVVLWVVVPAT